MTEQTEDASSSNEGKFESSLIAGVLIAFFALSLLHLIKSKHQNLVDPVTGVVIESNKYECLLGTTHTVLSKEFTSRNQRGLATIGEVVIEHFIELILFSGISVFVIYKGRTRKKREESVV